MPFLTIEGLFAMQDVMNVWGCGPYSQQKQEVFIDTEIKDPDWADAVRTNNIIGIKMLHNHNPDLANDPVTSDGHKAIHLAVQTRNAELLVYLLENGANINDKGGREGNTALHEAVLIHDMKAIRHLFSYGCDDHIRNRNGKRAIELCPKSMRREFTKAKTYRHKHLERLNHHHSRQDTNNDILIAGMSLRTTPAAQIRKYVKTTDDERNFYRDKKKEIEERHMALTQWGDEVGCEVDEIAMTLQKLPDPGKLWDKWAMSPSLTRQTEIYKILYGLTVLTLRQKDSPRKKPPKQRIKVLTTKVSKKLPKKKGKTTLTKRMFVADFHNTLYSQHADMLNGELNDTHALHGHRHSFLVR